MTEPPATSTSAPVPGKRVRPGGPVPFPDFMEEALYHPARGYYARGTDQVGRRGDFFTSVSVGPVFGKILARRFLRWWRENGRPDRWRIIESGAHDGTLAGDILRELRELDATAWDGLGYTIREPIPALRDAQQAALAGFGEKTRLMNPRDSAEEKLPGIAFGNELLDALPFHVIEWKGGRWQECQVAPAGDGIFQWQSVPIEPGPLADAVAPLGNAFPEGYRTEVRTGLKSFLAPLLEMLAHGLLVWPDYGFARPDYYHPDRTGGTLRTFSRHRAGTDPLDKPGESDITAHVDFTAVAEAGIGLGCTVAAFQSQGAWLTGNAREWLLRQEGNPDPAEMRQFQTLTHPAHLGRSFQVLELSWREPASPAPEDLRRLALRP